MKGSYKSLIIDLSTFQNQHISNATNPKEYDK